jgi:uncharacterized membrane protein
LDKRTLGERAADAVARFGGSWTFVSLFAVFMTTWMIIQWPLRFDPYPFILLNLILSTIAALQAPIIMMSQNRQAQKDRQRDEMDHKILIHLQELLEKSSPDVEKH